MMRIVHVAEIIKGGIASHLKQLVALQILRYGVDQVIVICPENQVQELNSLQKMGVRIAVFQRQPNRLLSAWQALKKYLAVTQGQVVDIVHVHSTFAGLVFRTVPWWIPAHKIVYCPHGWAFRRDSHTKYLAELIERFLACRCAAIICVSQNEKDIAVTVGIQSTKLHVIFNGLTDQTATDNVHVKNPDEMWPVAALRLLFIGRIDHAKGYDILLASLRHTHVPLCVQVFGDADASEAESTEVMHLPTSALVIRHGWQSFSVIAPYLSHCHAVVVPSRWEAGLPYSALEAMRASKAVIAADVAGIGDVVEHGQTGLVFQVGDVQSLAIILNEITVEQLEKMGAAGRQVFLEKFTDVPMEAAMHQLYVDVQQQR
jgi:glycosyltransferase involved in cell wall biosynthesis